MLMTGGVGCTEEAAGTIPRGRQSRAVPGSRGLRTAAAGLLPLGGGTDCFTLYALMIYLLLGTSTVIPSSSNL